MNEQLDKILTWVKANPLAAAGVALGAVMILKPAIFRTRRRRRRVSVAYRTRSHKKANRRKYSLRSSGRPAWMVKGSPAAKRHMAQIRRKRAA